MLLDNIKLMNTVIGIAEVPAMEKIYLDLSGRRGFTNPHNWCREPQVDLSCKEIMLVFRTIDRLQPGLVEFEKPRGLMRVIAQSNLRLTALGEEVANMLRGRER